MFKLSNYYKPTPANIRKFADAWAIFWGGLSVSSIVVSHQTFAIICLVMAYAGKAVSNFFSDDKDV